MTTSTKLTNEQLKEQVIEGMDLFQTNLNLLQKNNKPFPEKEELQSLLIELMPKQLFNLTAEQLRNKVIHEYIAKAAICMQNHASEMNISFSIMERHRKLFGDMKKIWETNGFTIVHEKQENREIIDDEPVFYVNISW